MQNRRFFPAFYGRAKTSLPQPRPQGFSLIFWWKSPGDEVEPPSQAFLREARISFLPTAVFYVKVRLIYKLCCYLGIFVSLKAATYLYQCSKVQLWEGTKYELPKDGCVASEDKRKVSLRPDISHFLFYLRVQRKWRRIHAG